MREKHRAFLQERDRAEHRAIGRLLDELLHPADNCVDIGASVGDVLAQILAAAPRGRHIAYEPVPPAAADLARRFAGVDVRACAVGRSPGRCAFRYVVDEPALSSARPLPYHDGHDVVDLEVDVQSLDRSLPVGFVPALIKIDAEGAELEILRGAAATLAEHRPYVVLEFIRDAAGPFAATAGELHELCRQAGLQLYDVFGAGPLPATTLRRLVHARRVQNFVAVPA